MTFVIFSHVLIHKVSSSHSKPLRVRRVHCVIHMRPLPHFVSGQMLNRFGHYLFGWHRLRKKGGFLQFNVRSAILCFFGGGCGGCVEVRGHAFCASSASSPSSPSVDGHLWCLYQHCGNNAVYFGKGGWFPSLIANVLCWDISATLLLSFTTPDAAKIGFLSPNGPADGFILALHWDIKPHCLISKRREGRLQCVARHLRAPSAVQAECRV